MYYVDILTQDIRMNISAREIVKQLFVHLLVVQSLIQMGNGLLKMCSCFRYKYNFTECEFWGVYQLKSGVRFFCRARETPFFGEKKPSFDHFDFIK